MSAIWKYPLIDIESVIEMPQGAEILHVASQDHVPTLWALVEPEFTTQPRYFTVIGTGHPFDRGHGDLKHLGTCHNVSNLGLVFHVFERVDATYG